jgi:hypothetical protein
MPECDFCAAETGEFHVCKWCAATFCLDCGYLRYNETGESDWVCFECAEGFEVCPNCGHAWNAHGAWIANKQMICEERSSE